MSESTEQRIARLSEVGRCAMTPADRLAALKRANATVQRRARRERERQRSEQTWAQRNWARIKADPKLLAEYRAKRRAYASASKISAKQWAALKNDDLKRDAYLMKHNANRKARVAHMSDDERKAELAENRRRRKERGYEAGRWAQIKADPEMHQRYLETQKRAREKAKRNPDRVAKQREYDRAYKQRARDSKTGGTKRLLTREAG